MNLQEWIGDHAWEGGPPADADVIQELADWSLGALPPEYLELLRLSDGGEGEFEGYPSYARLWPARTVIEYNQDYEVQRYLPGFIGFGDNGGPDLLLFDTRHGAPYPIVAVPFVPMELASAIDVAPDFGALLARLTPGRGAVSQ
jgi:hypothetical protein